MQRVGRHARRVEPAAVVVDADEQRAVAQKLTIDFAKKLSATVDALGQECNCVIVNKAALLGGVTIDYTDQVRARMK